ncbi:ABC transporter permease [Paenibacillus humicola]|uniref:ABC transporter permease n=1 Tax=Paenibacillus humicola TaxID=3110540 RepID=UPI00237C1314|nr:ABC transporter permease [Paenibacillus humicola]
MQLSGFLVKRLLAIAITTCVIIALSYTLMYYAPGSFFDQQLVAQQTGALSAANPQAYQDLMKQWEERYGLDKPLYEQIYLYIVHSFSLNFGTSFQNSTTPIMNTLKTAFPISVFLAIGSTFIAALIGIPLGIFAAIRRNSWVDYCLTTLSLGGQAIPPYVIAVFLMLIFGVFWPVLPINGWGTAQQTVLPLIALAIGNIGAITQYMRSSLIDTLNQDYIRTAKAKGVPEGALIRKHALRNSLVALVTIVGPQIAFTVVGATWIENLFSIPGLGTMLGNAFQANDYPLAVTSIFILSLLVMLMSLLVDIVYSLLDPRVKLGS